MNLYFGVLVNVDIYYHFIFCRQIFTQVDLDCRVAESFFREVLADDGLGAVNDVLCDLITFVEL